MGEEGAEGGGEGVREKGEGREVGKTLNVDFADCNFDLKSF